MEPITLEIHLQQHSADAIEASPQPVSWRPGDLGRRRLFGLVAGVAEAGTAIALMPADSSLQIVVNIDELGASQLTLSSQVLRLAKLVKREAR